MAGSAPQDVIYVPAPESAGVRHLGAAVFQEPTTYGCIYHLEKTFLYRKALTAIRTTITMGMGYRKVSTATQIIPTVRVFEKSMERMEPTISAGMICSVIFFSF